MFGARFNAPIITIASSPRYDFMDSNTGMVTPYAHVSHYILGFDDDMTFFQRWFNAWFSLASLFYHEYFHLSLQNQVARDHSTFYVYPQPTIQELIKNVTLTLVNSHPMLWPPRPAMPTLINVGGAHLRKPKPLPKNIQTYIDDALDGVVVVYFEKTFEVSEMQIFLGKFAQILCFSFQK